MIDLYIRLQEQDYIWSSRDSEGRARSMRT